MRSLFVDHFTSHFPDLLGTRVVIALSGGADSVALLHLMVAAGDTLACEPIAVHVHHHARGAAADGDARFCAALCERLGVPFERLDIDAGVERRMSREAYWRKERYRLLEEVRRDLECAAVATAHTADDQAETVLVKLLRGAGPRGVAGIRRRRGTVIRPLLELRREALRRWLRQGGIAWREDASNADEAPPRGFVRHRLLPLIAGSAPAAISHLTGFAAMLAEDEALLAALLAERAVWPTPRRSVELAAVASLPPPLRRRWTLELAARLPLREPPSRRQLAQVDALLAGGRPAAVDLGRRWVLRRRGDRLHLSPPPLPPFEPTPTTIGTEVRLAGGFVARVGCTGGAGRCHAGWLAGRLRGCTVVWRPTQVGERGPDGRRLAGRLAAVGVPAEWRRAWPVLEADGTMAWVAALGPVAEWAGDAATGVRVEVEEPWRSHVRS